MADVNSFKFAVCPILPRNVVCFGEAAMNEDEGESTYYVY